jgi:hypothetical protein
MIAFGVSFGMSFFGFFKDTTRDIPPATVEIPPVTL